MLATTVNLFIYLKAEETRDLIDVALMPYSVYNITLLYNKIKHML